MDEDYQASNDRDADEWYDQDGPDLFGQDEPPRDELRNSGSTDQTDSRASASKPEQDADPAADLGGEESAEPHPPLADGLVADVDAALVKQVLDVPKESGSVDHLGKAGFP